MTTQAPTSRTSFDNPASAEEKAAILQNEKRLNTRAAMQAVLDPSLSGRFAKEAKADFTVGRDEVVNYPRLPAGGPWGSGPQVGLEPPLGFSVNDLEPTGELHELQRSAATDNLLGGSCEDAAFLLGQQLAGVSPPLADDADLASPLLRSAPGPSPVPEVTSPLSSDSRATDPTLGSSGPSSFTPDQHLAAPPPDAASAPREGANRAEHRRGGAALSSRGSMTRRFG
jgi:hypothetical protein